MKLAFYIPPRNLIDTYDRVCNLLQSDPDVIFAAMATITQNRSNPFVPPTGPGEFAQKHGEIKNLLRYSRVLRGLETAISLMEEIGRQIQVAGGIVGVSADEVLDAILFKTSDPNVMVHLNQDLHWAVEWTVSSPIQGDSERSSVFLEAYSSNWGEIVPTYVIEYVNIAVYAYQQRMYGPAIALLSIAVEATLRDVLAVRGYTFNPGAPSADIFSYAYADVGVAGNSYIVTFRQPMPKSPTQFLHSTGGDPTIEVQVRREIKQRRGGNRVDLRIIASPILIDHWSSDNVEQAAQQRVNGLGEALKVAREQERFLTPNDLPPDFDEVFKLARNNLIHLSGQALSTPLFAFDPAGGYTLENFLDDPEMVYDLITQVPRHFINKQYVVLRRSGRLAP